MTQTVFLHYTQDALNRNFDKRAWVDNALEAIGRYSVHSRATRKPFAHQANIAYGTRPDEVLDFFPAGDSGGPVQVFIHGGAGRISPRTTTPLPGIRIFPKASALSL